MAHRAVTIATWSCAAFVALLLGLATASVWINPWDHYLSISQQFHIGIWGRGVDIRLVFFNDADYGPYRGSMISLDGNPPVDRAVYFGDTAGIYYRYFGVTDSSLWTLMLSIWYPIALLAILPVWHLLALSRGDKGKSPAANHHYEAGFVKR